MVKANELRIGNWIMFDGNLTQVDLGLFDMWGDVDIDERLNPIALTPEILEKCGFEKDEDANSDIYQLDIGRKSFRIQLSTTSIIFKFDVGMDWTSDIDAPEYLHQLQNLFFALSGEELPLNL